MFIFVIGTSGEAIKTAPVIRALTDLGASAMVFTTNQQPTQVRTTLARLSVNAPITDLANGWRGRDLEKPAQVPLWLATVIRGLLRVRPLLRRKTDESGDQPVVVVHGDTMTTVIGALFGKACGVTVGHIEAGMRSGDIRNPFPEEINRRLVAKLADLHYAPGAGPVKNLERESVKGQIVDTRANTVTDSLLSALKEEPRCTDFAGIRPDERFALVSLHRLELLHNQALLTDTIRALSESADSATPIVLMGHAPTVEAIEKAGLTRYFEGPLRLSGRLDYVSFAHILRNAVFVVTDSGGLQEECLLLGKPCLVVRRTTEHSLDSQNGIVLSHFRPQAIRDFVTTHSAETFHPTKANLVPDTSPSLTTAKSLVNFSLADSPALD